MRVLGKQLREKASEGYGPCARFRYVHAKVSDGVVIRTCVASLLKQGVEHLREEGHRRICLLNDFNEEVSELSLWNRKLKFLASTNRKASLVLKSETCTLAAWEDSGDVIGDFLIESCSGNEGYTALLVTTRRMARQVSEQIRIHQLSVSLVCLEDPGGLKGVAGVYVPEEVFLKTAQEVSEGRFGSVREIEIQPRLVIEGK
jgi:hypothetical protein